MLLIFDFVPPSLTQDWLNSPVSTVWQNLPFCPSLQAEPTELGTEAAAFLSRPKRVVKAKVLQSRRLTFLIVS